MFILFFIFIINIGMYKKCIGIAKQLDRMAVDITRVAIGSDVRFLSLIALKKTWPCN